MSKKTDFQPKLFAAYAKFANNSTYTMPLDSVQDQEVIDWHADKSEAPLSGFLKFQNRVADYNAQTGEVSNERSAFEQHPEDQAFYGDDVSDDEFENTFDIDDEDDDDDDGEEEDDVDMYNFTDAFDNDFMSEGKMTFSDKSTYTMTPDDKKVLAFLKKKSSKESYETMMELIRSNVIELKNALAFGREMMGGK